MDTPFESHDYETDTYVNFNKNEEDYEYNFGKVFENGKSRNFESFLNCEDEDFNLLANHPTSENSSKNENKENAFLPEIHLDDVEIDYKENDEAEDTSKNCESLLDGFENINLASVQNEEEILLQINSLNENYESLSGITESSKEYPFEINNCMIKLFSAEFSELDLSAYFKGAARKDAQIKKFKMYLSNDIISECVNLIHAYNRSFKKKFKLYKIKDVQKPNIDLNKLFMQMTIREALCYNNDKNYKKLEELAKHIYGNGREIINDFLDMKVKVFARLYISSNRFLKDVNQIKTGMKSNNEGKKIADYIRSYLELVFGDGFQNGIIDYFLIYEGNKKSSKDKNKKKEKYGII